MAPRKTVLLALGVLAMLAGLVLVLRGLAPVQQVFGLFGGGSPDPDFMDDLVSDLKAGGVLAGVGFALFIVGFVLFKVARARPRAASAPPAPSVEELVAAEVERRLAALPPAPAAPAAPRALVAPAPVAMPVPAALPAPAPPAAAVSPASASAAPGAAPALAAPPAVVPAEAPPASGRCPRCGGILVAAGRFCGNCGRVG